MTADLAKTQREKDRMIDTSITKDAKSQSMVPFFVVWTGQGISLLGSQLVQFALVWWLTVTTGSATVLAFATMMALLPQIFLSPVAGALVDRWNRRVLMMAADGMIALVTVVLAVLYAADLVQVWHIYGLMLIRATGAAFHSPAMQASTTLMVPEKHLSRVAGLNQTVYGIANIVAPPLGALLLALLPVQGVLAVDVGTAMLAIVPLLFIHVPQPQQIETSEKAKGHTSVLTDLHEGLRFVWGWPGMTMVVVIATLFNLLVTPGLALVPIMVTEYFGGGAAEFAWMGSAVGVGMVLGGITLAVWGGFKRRMVTVVLALILLGIGIAAVGLIPATAFPLALGAMFFVGLMSPIASGSLFAVLQVTVPPEMQGRVFTLVMSGSAATAPLGLAIAGPVADAIGVQVWFLVGGIAAIVMGVGALFVPAIMRIEDKAAQAVAASAETQAATAGGGKEMTIGTLTT